MTVCGGRPKSPSQTHGPDPFLTSLADLERFDDHEVLPGHGYRPRPDGQARACLIRRHRLFRTQEIAARLSA